MLIYENSFLILMPKASAINNEISKPLVTQTDVEYLPEQNSSFDSKSLHFGIEKLADLLDAVLAFVP